MLVSVYNIYVACQYQPIHPWTGLVQPGMPISLIHVDSIGPDGIKPGIHWKETTVSIKALVITGST